MAVILLKRNERGRVSLMYSSNMWGLTKGQALTWDISADLRKAINRELRKTVGRRFVTEFNRP